MTVKLGSRPTAPSPFAGPEGQSFASRSATPAPSPRRSHARHTQHAALAQPLRSVSFRSLAPKSSTFTGAEQQRPLQPQPQALPQRAASCVAVPRLQSPAAAPLSASAVLPATCAPAAGAPTAAYHAPDSALAWAAGFSRLATQLGCAAPAPCGGLWDPPESSDLLVLLTMELRSVHPAGHTAHVLMAWWLGSPGIVWSRRRSSPQQRHPMLRTNDITRLLPPPSFPAAAAAARAPLERAPAAAALPAPLALSRGPRLATNARSMTNLGCKWLPKATPTSACAPPPTHAATAASEQRRAAAAAG